VNRDGKRADEVFMGVLREDWERAKGARDEHRIASR